MELTGDNDLEDIMRILKVQAPTTSQPGMLCRDARHGLERYLVPTVSIARVDGAVHVRRGALTHTRRAAATRSLESSPE